MVNCWYRVVTNLELSHGVGQPLCTASAGNETNCHLRKSKATVMRSKNEVTLKKSVNSGPGVNGQKNYHECKLKTPTELSTIS